MCGAEEGSRFVEPFLVDVGKRYLHSLARKCERHRAAEAAAAAGDRRGLSLQVFHCTSSHSAASRHRLSRNRSRKKPKCPIRSTPISPGVTFLISGFA